MMKDLARQARKMRPGTWLISLQPFSPESLDEADVSADASAQGTSTEAAPATAPSEREKRPWLVLKSSEWFRMSWQNCQVFIYQRSERDNTW
jgi:hypothetical protein